MSGPVNVGGSVQSKFTRVILVHGVGEQKKGDALSDIVEPVIGYMNHRLRDEDDKGLLYIRGTNRRHDTPSKLLAWLYHPPRKWLFSEVWWAQEFRSLGPVASILWLLRILWYAVEDFWRRVVVGNSTFFPCQALRPASVLIWSGVILLWIQLGHFDLIWLAGINGAFLALIVATGAIPWRWPGIAVLVRSGIWVVFALPLFLAVFLSLVLGMIILVALLIINAIPVLKPTLKRVPMIGEALEGFVDELTAFISGGMGDVPAYSDYLVKQVEIGSPLAQAIEEALDGADFSDYQIEETATQINLREKPNHLVIVAHSLGAVIVNDVLRWSRIQSKLDTNAIPITVITFGAALRKVWKLRKTDTTVVGPLPSKIRWLHVYGHWDPIANGRLLSMVETDPRLAENYRLISRTRIDYLHSENLPPFWQESATDYTPWADAYSGNQAEFAINFGVTNRDLISLDHVTYWTNEDQVISLICRVIWGDYGDDPAGGSANPFGIGQGAEKERVDLRIARASATGLLARATLILLPTLTFSAMLVTNLTTSVKLVDNDSSSPHPLFALSTQRETEAPSLQGGDDSSQVAPLKGNSWLLKHWPEKLNFVLRFLKKTLPDDVVDPLINAAWVALGVLLLSGLIWLDFEALEHVKRRRWIAVDRKLARRSLS